MFKNFCKNNSQLKLSFGKMKDEYFDFDLIEKYFRNKDESNAFQVLSDKTCNDLDFNELFMFLDRTNSKVGQQYLYKKLRTIPCGSNSNNLDEEIIEMFANDENFRIQVQSQLTKLKKDNAYYISSLFQEEHQKPPKWFWIVKVLSLCSLFSILMLYFWPLFIMLLLPVIIVNIGIHYWNKKNLHQYLGSIPQLLTMQAIAKFIYKKDLLQKIDPQLTASLAIIDQVKSRMSFFQFEARIQGDLQSAFWVIFEFIKTVFLLEPLLLFGVLKRLNTKRHQIENVFEFVGKVDALISIASLRNGTANYCIPNISENTNSIETSHLYHPLILNCVCNDIEVADKSVLLTGSNMSGKTSFIRTIGLNVLTGLTINTCFAKSMSMPRAKLYSAIRISDDLMNDKSYYFEEVLTIKEMIQKSSEEYANLFLLDELFKGTNTIERISAGKAVLSCLRRSNNIVFVSTHDIELTDLLEEEYDLYHFSEIVNDNNIDFDYKLKKGRLKNRNAIRILQINDYPSSVVKEAFTISNELDVSSKYVKN